MNKYLFAIAMGVFSCCASMAQTSSTQTWIGIVGINPTHLHQNFSDFYHDARDFLDVCQSSTQKPNCLLYMNTDLKYSEAAANSDQRQLKELADLKLPSVPHQNAADLLAIIQNKIVSAKAGSTVIVSLMNHGVPSYRGNSCVLISVDENDRFEDSFICESDLKNILKLKPPGVKILIDVNACFAGAFTDLASDEVCVTTWSDRRDFAESSSNLWKAIADSKAKSLADLRRPLVFNYLKWPTLGSQSMLNLVCSEFRAQVMRNQMDSVLSSEFSSEKVCEFSAHALEDLSDLTQSVLIHKSCRDLGVSGETCEAFKKLQTPVIRKKMAEIAALINREEDLRQEGINYIALLPDDPTFTQDQNNLIKSKLTNEMEGFPDLTSDEMKQIDQSPLKEKLAQVEKKFSALNEIKKIEQNIPGLKNQLPSEINPALEILEPCLFNIERDEKLKKAMTYLDLSGAKKRFPRQFTQKDIDGAKKCEASIHF